MSQQTALRPLMIDRLPGLTPYEQVWALQRDLVDQRLQALIPDTLLLLQHPHTYTLGRAGDPANLLMGEAERQQRGVAFLHVDRGGDITYHGPGQLVAYPILALTERPQAGQGRLKADIIAYIRDLEEVLLHTTAYFGIQAQREPGLTGVWVPETPQGLAKIAAIGVKVTAKAITLHGVALNINPDLDYFAGIVPCGIEDKAVTSLQALLGGGTPSFEEVSAVFSRTFCDIFGYQQPEGDQPG